MKVEVEIFVQIAAYRDPELVPTISDALDKATRPSSLKFVVCWQYHPDDPFTEVQRGLLYSNPNIKVLECDLSKQISGGACWARNWIQQQYEDEEYTLQLDSHMRFSQGYDDACIDMLHSLIEEGHEKPLITTYAPAFDPAKEPNGRLNEVWRMDFDRFCPEGWIATAPSVMTGEELNKPLSARFYSAHFAFAEGCFVKEVPHDPEFYFHGEEPSIAIRAFTHGYDLFHPNKIIVWHEYTRNGKTKQWDDDTTWTLKNNLSHSKYRRLFGMDGEAQEDFGIYGLGKIRTLEDYKIFAGIEVAERKVQEHTLNRKPPPNPPDEEFKPFFRHCIDLYAPNFPEQDYDFWVVSFELKDGTVIHRQDADRGEVFALIHASKTDGDWIRLWRQYYGPFPDKAIIWPHSETKGWLERIEIQLSR